MKYISKFILKLMGWEIDNTYLPTFNKFVAIQAPHTSNWDFVIGKLIGYSLEVYPKVFMKNALFFFPLGILLKKLGGIPVDKNIKGNLVSEIAYQIIANEKFSVAVTPEGTRSYNSDWRKGFYYIAKATNVPVVPFYIDYKNKIAGFDHPFELSDDVDADIAKLKIYFKQFTGRNPENGVR